MIKRNNFSIVKQLLKKNSIVFEKQRLILHENNFVLHNISRFLYIVTVNEQLIRVINNLSQYKFYKTFKFNFSIELCLKLKLNRAIKNENRDN